MPGEGDHPACTGEERKEGRGHPRQGVSQGPVRAAYTGAAGHPEFPGEAFKRSGPRQRATLNILRKDRRPDGPRPRPATYPDGSRARDSALGPHPKGFAPKNGTGPQLTIRSG